MRTSPQRRDPQTLTHGWELATLVLAGAAAVVAGAALLGVGVASLLSGDGWAWPHTTTAAGRILAALAHGHSTVAGRSGAGGHPPGAAAVYAAVGGCELLALTAIGATTVLTVRCLRPGGPERGMASRREAADALGLRALRAARPIVRPDQHPTRPSVQPASTATATDLREER